MNKFKFFALALTGAFLASAPANAFCLVGCEPGPADARKVFENLVKKKFDPDAQVVDFNVERFWRLDVEGFGHKSVEFYFKGKVNFPKGANLDCKPAADGSAKDGCSTSQYFSTTVRNVEVKGRQYIEPGRTIDFNDETRFDEDPKGWKGQDGNTY